MTKPIIIDTREPFEYMDGHVDGAINIPPAEFMRDYVISGFESAAKAAERKANLPDLMQILDNAMGVDIEVAHIDQPFIRLFATLPGYQMRD